MSQDEVHTSFSNVAVLQLLLGASLFGAQADILVAYRGQGQSPQSPQITPDSQEQGLEQSPEMPAHQRKG